MLYEDLAAQLQSILCFVKESEKNLQVREKDLLHLEKNNSVDSPISLTVCQFLLHQCCLNGFLWDVLVREPLVARRHQRHCVSVTVAVWRVAPRLGAVAAGVAVVASV